MGSNFIQESLISPQLNNKLPVDVNSRQSLNQICKKWENIKHQPYSTSLFFYFNLYLTFYY